MDVGEDKQLKILVTLLNMQGGCLCSCGCGARYPIVDVERKSGRIVLFICKIEGVAITIPYDLELQHTVKHKDYANRLKSFNLSNQSILGQKANDND